MPFYVFFGNFLRRHQLPGKDSRDASITDGKVGICITRQAHSSFFSFGCILVDGLHQPGRGSERPR